MADVDSMLTGGTEDDQKKNGTFQTNFQTLKGGLQRLLEGGVDPHHIEEIFMTLLRGFENERLSCERNIKKLERQIEWERAKQHACAQHAALLLGIVGVQLGRKESQQAQMPQNDPSPVLTDKELLKTICICGCRDEEDAANCDCPCHHGGFCENPRCSVCPGKKAAIEASEQETKTRKKTTTKSRSKKAPAKTTAKKK